MEKFEEQIFQAIGRASMCWSEIPTGIYDSTEATKIGSDLVTLLQTEIAKRNNETVRAIEIFEKEKFELQENIKSLTNQISKMQQCFNNPVTERNFVDCRVVRTPEEHSKDFIRALASVINSFNIDNQFCVPDFILAEIIFRSIPFLKECQASFDKAAALQKKPSVDKS